MKKYIFRKLLNVFSVIILLSIGLFILGELAPGDFVTYIAGEEPETTQLQLRTQYTLNLPVQIRAYKWLERIALGKPLMSYAVSSKELNQLVFNFIQFELTFITLSILTAYFLVISLMVICVKWPNSIWDSLIRLFTYIGNAVPEFVLALAVIFICSYSIKGLEFIGRGKLLSTYTIWDYVYVSITPFVILTYKITAIFLRYLRSSVFEVMNEEYIKAAKSRGVYGVRLYFGYILKNASLPLLTLNHVFIPEIIGTMAILELLFRLPGLGGLLIISSFSRDIPLVISITLIICFFSIFVSFITDMLYAILDPRIRYN